jgi:hypothetical protein
MDLAMRKEDFTPETIYDELQEYTFQRNYPDDELNEIGGSHISGVDIDDIEVTSVAESSSGFIVKGSATLDVTTDLGEGDTFSDSYPMTFAYEFDDNGKIVRQLSREIDTSSFFAGSELDEYLVGLTSEHLEVFQGSIMDILSLIGDPIGGARPCLHRVLFVNVITVLECYLADFFISRISSDKNLLRKLIETTPQFQEHKVSVSEVFETMETMDQRAHRFLASQIWHRLDRVKPLYERVLKIVFPPDMKVLIEAIRVRHELVHRNGKKEDGTQREITEMDIRNTIRAAEELVTHIEDRWREISSPF